MAEENQNQEERMNVNRGGIFKFRLVGFAWFFDCQYRRSNIVICDADI